MGMNGHKKPWLFYCFSFWCVNSEQPAGIMCKDFEARFCCSKPKPTCEPNGEWTQWYDRDNPSGTGDHEVLNLLIKD